MCTVFPRTVSPVFSNFWKFVAQNVLIYVSLSMIAYNGLYFKDLRVDLLKNVKVRIKGPTCYSFHATSVQSFEKGKKLFYGIRKENETLSCKKLIKTQPFNFTLLSALFSLSSLAPRMIFYGIHAKKSCTVCLIIYIIR